MRPSLSGPRGALSGPAARRAGSAGPAGRGPAGGQLLRGARDRVPPGAGLPAALPRPARRRLRRRPGAPALSVPGLGGIPARPAQRVQRFCRACVKRLVAKEGRCVLSMLGRRRCRGEGRRIRLWTIAIGAKVAAPAEHACQGGAGAGVTQAARMHAGGHGAGHAGCHAAAVPQPALLVPQRARLRLGGRQPAGRRGRRSHRGRRRGRLCACR